MCGILLNSYYILLYELKLRDMSFLKILNLCTENNLNILHKSEIWPLLSIDQNQYICIIQFKLYNVLH